MNRRVLIIVLLFLVTVESCSNSSGPKINGDSVRIELGQNNTDNMELTLYVNGQQRDRYSACFRLTQDE